MAPGNDIAVETTAQPPANWDESIRQGTCAQLTLYHTVAWARRMRGLLGFEPIFVTTSEGGEPALRLLAFSRWPPGIRGLKNSARYLASALRHARLGSLIWHGEPVVVGDAGERHYQSMSEGLGLEARRTAVGIARPDPGVLREYVRFGFPLVAVAVFSWVSSSSDRYVISWFHIPALVGAYSVAYTLGMYTAMLFSPNV